MARIALIEDEPPLVRKYHELLTEAGHEVVDFLTKEEAKKGLIGNLFDAWILDLNLDSDQAAGIELLGWAKDKNLQVPTLVVSGLDPEHNGRTTRALGVWDFVSKPVDDDTLVFKISQLLNVLNRPDEKIPDISDLDINLDHPGIIHWRSKRINIPLTPYKLLIQLIKTPDEPVTYATLYKCVGTGANRDNIRAHIRILRQSFKDFDQEFSHIDSVTGVGYIWRI